MGMLSSKQKFLVLYRSDYKVSGYPKKEYSPFTAMPASKETKGSYSGYSLYETLDSEAEALELLKVKSQDANYRNCEFYVAQLLVEVEVKPVMTTKTTRLD